jgi:hypothetical protein
MTRLTTSPRRLGLAVPFANMQAADRMGMNAISIELNAENVAMQKRRVLGDAGMFAEVRA